MDTITPILLCNFFLAIHKLGILTDPVTGVDSFVLMILWDDMLLLNTVMVINGFKNLKTAANISAEMWFI